MFLPLNTSGVFRACLQFSTASFGVTPICCTRGYRGLSLSGHRADALGVQARVHSSSAIRRLCHIFCSVSSILYMTFIWDDMSSLDEPGSSLILNASNCNDVFGLWRPQHFSSKMICFGSRKEIVRAGSSCIILTHVPLISAFSDIFGSKCIKSSREKQADS